tara:strand:+ start:619 stop:1029 length:411 start_codon:yes stop_codon:yes gene_type:complete
MEEEFYATIKLVSGEEIVARIAYMPEEESCLIHEPMEVEHVVKKGKGIDGFTLKDWIHASFDDLFVLPKIHILTMSECDKRIEEFYLKCLSQEKKSRQLAAENRERGTTNKLVPGYLGSVEQSRQILEKIYLKETD